MTKVFTECSRKTMSKLEKLLEGEHLHGGKTIELDLEAEFSNLALDIIGLGVFNYDFGSVTKESPVIKVLEINILLEACHGVAFLFQYIWIFIFIQYLHSCCTCIKETNFYHIAIIKYIY